MDAAKVDSFYRITLEQFIGQARKLAGFIHENKISHVVVAGSTAQSAANMVKVAWNASYPRVKLPTFIAFGKIQKTAIYTAQRGRESFELRNPSEKSLAEYHAAGYTVSHVDTSFVAQRTKNQPNSAILKDLTQRLIHTPRNSSVLVFDEHTSSLHTLKNFRSVLGTLGFSNIQTAALTASEQIRKQPELSRELNFVGAFVTKAPAFLYGDRRQTVNSILALRKHRATLTKDEIVKKRTAVKEFVERTLRSTRKSVRDQFRK